MMHLLPSAICGFLIGFVGWASVFRLPQPVAEWMMEHRGNGRLMGVVKLLLVLLLLASMFLLLGLLPLTLLVLGGSQPEVPKLATWRDLYGASFFGSLVGFFTFGFFRRLLMRRSRPPR
jgi:hypothetical protein